MPTPLLVFPLILVFGFDASLHLQGGQQQTGSYWLLGSRISHQLKPLAYDLSHWLTGLQNLSQWLTGLSPVSQIGVARLAR